MTNDLPLWYKMAQGFIGEHEIKGTQHNPKIVNFFKNIHSSWFRDDETPWCAAYVGSCLEQAGIKSTRSAAALSYLKWGVALSGPAVGAVAVMKRQGGGHVAFVAGRDQAGNIVLLGGNQGDKVSLAPFDRNRIVAYRWPDAVPLSGNQSLPVINDLTGKLGGSEA